MLYTSITNDEIMPPHSENKANSVSQDKGQREILNFLKNYKMKLENYRRREDKAKTQQLVIEQISANTVILMELVHTMEMIVNHSSESGVTRWKQLLKIKWLV